QLHGDDNGSDLTDALAKDKHMRAFLSIPGKDNGFDIEGLAVVGDRIFIGLRGPVLRGWALILELELKEAEGKASTLELKPNRTKGYALLQALPTTGWIGNPRPMRSWF